MNVLSLFDGMSCGQIALERAGIPVTNYFASEIDKYAIKVTQANYPKTIQLGCITEQSEWYLDKIDLVIGGTPCQGFSFAGKQLNFDDPRSKLFFDYVEALHRYKPKYFLLENVKMKQEYQDIITRMLGGIKPILINSALVSAQNRNRLYWTNIPGVTHPDDKGILLKDIIESDGFGMTYNRKDGLKDIKDKSVCLNASDWRGLNRNQTQTAIVDIDKSHCLDANYYKSDVNESVILDNNRVKGITENERGFRPHRGDVKKTGISELGRILKPTADKTDTLTSTHAPKILTKEFVDRDKAHCLDANYYKGGNLKSYFEKHRRQLVFSDNEQLTYRKLTPLECERLQTVPDNYTNHVSNTQRYKMLGNGWTVDVIAHIFKGLI